jgi:hypothetical protein
MNKKIKKLFRLLSILILFTSYSYCQNINLVVIDKSHQFDNDKRKEKLSQIMSKDLQERLINKNGINVIKYTRKVTFEEIKALSKKENNIDYIITNVIDTIETKTIEDKNCVSGKINVFKAPFDFKIKSFPFQNVCVKNSNSSFNQIASTIIEKNIFNLEDILLKNTILNEQNNDSNPFIIVTYSKEPKEFEIDSQTWKSSDYMLGIKVGLLNIGGKWGLYADYKGSFLLEDPKEETKYSYRVADVGLTYYYDKGIALMGGIGYTWEVLKGIEGEESEKENNSLNVNLGILYYYSSGISISIEYDTVPESFGFGIGYRF